MNNLDKIKNLYEVYHLAGKPQIIDGNFGGNAFILSYSGYSDSYASATEILNNSSINYEIIEKEEIRISLEKSNLGYKLFINVDNFLRTTNKEKFDDDFGILIFGESFVFYSKSENLYYNNLGSDSKNLLIKNTFLYFEILEYLEKISDYYNGASKEFVFYINTKGILRVKYPLAALDLSNNENFEKIYNLLIKYDKTKEFKLFFKTELFDYINGDFDYNIQEIIEKLSIIIDSANRNLQLYLKGFDWEKFRNKLKIEKQKYFNSFSDILGKVLSQLISIPISVSATFLALNSVTDINLIRLILLAYLTYVVIIVKIEFIYYSDIQEIEKDFEKEFTAIADTSGYNSEEIREEKEKIVCKIKKTKRIIVTFIASVITLFILQALIEFIK